MKLSINLSDVAAEQLQRIVNDRRSNPSVVLETSLLRFADLEAADQERDLRHQHNLRKAATRDGWMRVFWEALAEEFNVTDFDLTGDGNLLTPRSHAGYSIVFLLDDRTPTSGPIHIHVFQSPPAPDNRSLIHNWTFNKTDSVYSAARSVAHWIREHAVD